MDTALIISNVVEQVWRGTPSNNIELPESQQGELVEFEPGTITAGMVWDGENVSVPVKPLEDLKAESISEIRRQHAEELDKLDLDNSDLNVIHTQNEKNTWAKQQEWAERYLQNPDDLDAKNKLEGMLTDNEILVLTASELPLAATMAHNILTEADKKEKLLIKANKMRRTAEEAIHSATSHEELAAIKEQLKAAKDAAEAEFIAAQQT